MAQTTIAIFACEASGDVLGGALMRHMAAEHASQFRFFGIGGPLMRAAGLEAWYESEQLSVMGFVEVIAVLPRLLAMQRDCKRRIRKGADHAADDRVDSGTNARIDMVIGIDAPDFNFALERTAKAAGIAAIHWVSPSVWAWREKRLNKIKKCVNEVLCLFPMELPYYERYGIKATFVGHPLADRIRPTPSLKPTEGHRAIALLPGSRRSEVKRLMPVYMAWLEGWHAAYPRDTIIIPAATPTIGAYIRTLLADAHDNANIHIQAGDAQGAMRQADAVVLASGTATLEAMLLGKPMVVVYKVAWLSAWIYRARLTTAYVSLPNYLLNAHIGAHMAKNAKTLMVPELLQDACTPSAIHQALEHALKTPPAYLAHFERIGQELRRDAIPKVAARVLAYSGGNTP